MSLELAPKAPGLVPLFNRMSIFHEPLFTFGSFTLDAQEFAMDKSIDLIGGNQLIKLISEVQKSGNISATEAENVTCPKCDSEMVLREAKRGKYAGQKFWGCSEFPKCRGVIGF